MRFSILAAAALLINTVAAPAASAQSEAQATPPTPQLDGDAQCAMFMRNIIVQLLLRGNLSRGERAYFDRYGVLFNYFAGRFSVGHEAAAAGPVLKATVSGLSRDVQARMDCYHGGDGTMKDVQAQIDRAVPAGRNESGAGAASSVPSAASGAAAEDASCIAAAQRLANQGSRLKGREEMRNPAHIVRAVQFHAGRLVARGGSAAIEPAVAAAFAALPSEQASADALGFRCVANATGAIDAFSEAIAAAEAGSGQ